MAVTVAQSTYSQIVAGRDSAQQQLASSQQQLGVVQQQIDYCNQVIADYTAIIAELEVATPNG